MLTAARRFCPCLLAGIAALASTLAQAQAPSLAFVHVNVVPMDTERVLHDTTVLVRDGRIAAIGRDVTVPPDARVIDGHGQAYLAPGLADMHVHSDSADELGVHLAYGITTVLNMGGASSEFVGQVVPAINSGRRPGPHVYLAFRVDGTPRYGQFVVTTPDEARAVVRLARTNGYRFIKVYNDLTPPVFEALVDEGRARGVPVVGHGVTAVGLERQLAAGQVLVAHLEEFLYTVFPRQARADDAPPAEAIAPVVAMTKRSGAFVTADLFTFQTIAQQWGRPDQVADYLAQPEVATLAPGERIGWPDEGYVRRTGSLEARWRFLAAFANALKDAGVPLVAGTDAPGIPGVFPGRSLHDDLDALAAAGFSPFEALSTATRTPGEFIQRTLGGEPFGTVSAGARADLVMTQDNPLERPATLREPVGVMAAGQWYSKADLRRIVSRVKERYGRAAGGTK